MSTTRERSLIYNLLKAGEIVGLDPREMTAIALDELARDAASRGACDTNTREDR